VGIAENQRRLRTWANEQQLPHFFDAGHGIAHQLVIEHALARPGAIIVGSDSHSTAYGAVGALGSGMGATDIALALATGSTWMRVPETIRVEATGSLPPGVEPKDLALHLAGTLGADGAHYAALEYHGLDDWSVGARTTLASMAVELGAKAGLVVPTGLPERYPVPEWLADSAGAPVARTVHVDLGALVSQVARPGRVDDVVALDGLLGTPLDVVYVGTCTNGRAEDMRSVADALDGRPVAPGTRLMVVPASRSEYAAAVDDGTVGRLLAAGATIGPPGCGACIGRHLGVLAADETCLFTGNRNFVGRMGSPDARIFLGSPATAGASAATGVITAPSRAPRVTGFPALSPVHPDSSLESPIGASS
jgi:methanogen homoaconitase large subunit